MKKHHQINYIEFSANDLPKVKKFYESVFGWKFTDYGPEYTAFNDGSTDGGFAKGAAPKKTGSLVILYSKNLLGAITKAVRWLQSQTLGRMNFTGIYIDGFVLALPKKK